MKFLRTNILKTALGAILLVILLLKVCAPSLSHFASCNDPLAVEKNLEEGKENKEITDKTDKKMLTCEFFYVRHGHLILADDTKRGIHIHEVQLGSHPLITVPTPPPNRMA